MSEAQTAPLVITPLEDEIIRKRLITQTAQTKKGVDYPIKRLVKAFWALKDAIDGEDASAIAETREAFLTELDTYEFNMGRYSTVVAANRAQQEAYDDEEDRSRDECAALKASVAELKAKLGESVLERRFRRRREAAARACAEFPARAAIARENDELRKSIERLRAKRDERANKIDQAKKRVATLLRVVDGFEHDS